MLSSLRHSGVPSVSPPRSVSAEGSQTASTMGALTVSTPGEEQRGAVAGTERPAVYVVVTIILYLEDLCNCTTIVFYSERIMDY